MNLQHFKIVKNSKRCILTAFEIYFSLFNLQLSVYLCNLILGTESYHRGGGLEYVTGPPNKECSDDIQSSTDDVQKMLDEQQWNKVVFEKVQGMDNNWNAGIDHANSKDAQGKYIRKNQKSENGESGVQFMYYGKKKCL